MSSRRTNSSGEAARTERGRETTTVCNSRPVAYTLEQIQIRWIENENSMMIRLKFYSYCCAAKLFWWGNKSFSLRKTKKKTCERITQSKWKNQREEKCFLDWIFAPFGSLSLRCEKGGKGEGALWVNWPDKPKFLWLDFFSPLLVYTYFFSSEIIIKSRGVREGERESVRISCVTKIWMGMRLICYSSRRERVSGDPLN